MRSSRTPSHPPSRWQMSKGRPFQILTIAIILLISDHAVASVRRVQPSLQRSLQRSVQTAPSSIVLSMDSTRQQQQPQQQQRQTQRRLQEPDANEPPKWQEIRPGQIDIADGDLGPSGGHVDLQDLKLKVIDLQNGMEGGQKSAGESILDVLIFALPQTCTSLEQCNYPERAGIGYIAAVNEQQAIKGADSIAPNTIFWCQQGRIVVDSEKFTGLHQQIMVPAYPTEWNQDHVQIAHDLAGNRGVVFLANCNQQTGRTILVAGEVAFRKAPPPPPPQDKNTFGYDDSSANYNDGQYNDGQYNTNGNNQYNGGRRKSGGGIGGFLLGLVFVYGCYKLYNYWVDLAQGAVAGDGMASFGRSGGRAFELQRL